ncbi:hypothetical protein ON058_08525 [Demequina sp. B12]|uniref:hypothetical protein n=1 Tax=Demequina sp. B12 TaxID=2992757 RepID=UPI00237AF07B|nr:hypothetical protein [Demequina sp. B12]MDE0573460.1 hypothetical protein [Demequina sp. B12]
MPRTLVASVHRAARTSASAVAVFSLLALTACTGGGGATVTPTPDESPVAAVTETPSASPTPTALTEEDVLAALPEQALTEDYPGANAFAGYFLENFQDLAREDPELFVALVDKSCKFCANILAAHDEARRSGTTITGGDVELMSPYGGGGLQTDGTYGIEFDIRTLPITETSSTGEVTASSDGGEGSAAVILAFDERWRVLEVGSTRDDS